MPAWKNWVRQVFGWLYQDTSEWQPGYWGRIPYLFILRCLVGAGICLRFWIHTGQPVPRWATLIPLAAILIAVTLHRTVVPKYHKPVYSLVVALDIVFISIAYIYTGVAESDFFLFYYLPIFTAAEFLAGRYVLAAAIMSTLAFGGVIATLSVLYHQSLLLLGVRVFLAREVFYVAICLVSALRLRRERDSRQRSLLRQQQMQHLLECKQITDQMYDVGDVLQEVVVRASADLDAKFAVGLINAPNLTSEDPLRLMRWSGGGESPDARTLSLCRQAFAGENHAGSALVVAGGAQIGAIAVGGLPAQSRYNSSEYLRSVVEFVAGAFERKRLFDALREIGTATSSVVELNRELDRILDYVVDTLELEYATISLVDPYKSQIRTVRGRNVPPGWIAGSVHSLDSTDIQALVIRTGQAKRLDRWDDSFDWAIYDRYNHERLARVYAPIVATDGGERKVVGTIEAGCAKDQQSRLLDPAEDKIIALGERCGNVIARNQPHVLLDLIASRASDLIHADSASLHVFNGADEFLVAGSGRASKEFLHRHPPSRNGLGQAAMELGVRQVCNALPESKRELRELGIYAMTAFPFRLGNKIRGVLYIHFWRPHQFSAAELELVSVFVPQIAVAIQDSLHLQNMSRVDEKDWMVAGLHNVLRSLSSDLDHLVDNLTSDALYLLDAKNVTLYQYYQDDGRFSRAIYRGRFEHPELMKMDVCPDDIVSKAVGAGHHRFIYDATKDEELNEARRDEINRPRFVKRERVGSCAILVLKSPHSGEIVGCLFANYEAAQDPVDPRIKGLESLATSLAAAAAVAIMTARQNWKAIRRRENEIAALRAIGDRIVAGGIHPDLSDIGDVLLDQALLVLGGLSRDVTMGHLLVWNDATQRLDMIVTRGDPPGWTRPSVALGSGIIGWVAQHQEPARVDDIMTDSRYVEFTPDTRSEIAVPLVEGGRLLGVINIEHRRTYAFTDRDLDFLKILAVQAMIALHSTELYGRLNKLLSIARNLSVTAGRIRNTYSGLEVGVRMVLAGITSGQGLGFSRAILFEMNENRTELHGSLATGSLTREDATKIWRGIENNDFESALDDAQRFGEAVVHGHPETPLTLAVRGMRIPVNGAGVISGCLNSAVVRSLKAIDLPLEHLGELYLDAPRCSVAIVPLRVQGKAMGILLVDNRFLPMEPDPFDSSWEPLLAAFAELAAMIIEFTKLRSRLENEGRLARWREVITGLAHVLWRLAAGVKKLGRAASADIFNGELELASKTLEKLDDDCTELVEHFEKMKAFGLRPELVVVPQNVNYILQHTAENCHPPLACQVEFKMPPNCVSVMGDQLWLPYIFKELLYNADREMKAAQTVNPTITVVLSRDPATQMAVIEIGDNGPGVPEDIRQVIFEFGVSRSGGTGVGLAKTYDLVAQHHGSIAYEFRDGARFIVRLPMAVEEAVATCSEY